MLVLLPFALYNVGVKVLTGESESDETVFKQVDEFPFALTHDPAT